MAFHNAKLHGWGRGQFQAAKSAMIQESDCLEGHRPTLPRISLPNLTAPGPTGERPEHLKDCLSANCAGPKRRLRRALDAFTIQWATGAVSNDARWLLNTSMFWLKKEAGVDLKDEDAAWLVDCQEDDIVAEMEVEEENNQSPHVQDSVLNSNTHTSNGKPGVRPIQMGEFLRKYVTRRMLAVDKLRIQCSMTNARQWGVGVSGGTEAIIHTHYAIEELFFKGKLPRPIAAIQVDQNSMFGSLEWSGIRDAILDEVPNFAASTSWKHSSSSYIEQPHLPDHAKNRGAEQGDASAPLEAGATQAGIARKARIKVHAQQRQGTLAWCSNDTAPQASQEHDSIIQQVAQWTSLLPSGVPLDLQTARFHATQAIRYRNPEELSIYGI